MTTDVSTSTWRRLSATSRLISGYRQLAGILCHRRAGPWHYADGNRLIAEGVSENSGYIAMKKLLPLEPDAIFAQSDVMAIGAMRAVQEVGLEIPKDVAFVGFDDLPIASTLQIKLTTVHQPITHFGIKAVDLLLDMIDKGSKPVKRMILDTELIIRDTCGANIIRRPTVEGAKMEGSALKALA